MVSFPARCVCFCLASSWLVIDDPYYSSVETQFIDYRFLKDLELRKEPKCCCFCVGQELLIYADDKDSVRQVTTMAISQ